MAQATLTAQVKPCSRCHLPQSLEAFSPRKNRPDGRTSFCRSCDRKRQKLRRQRPEVKVQSAAYYQLHRVTLNSQTLLRRAVQAKILDALKQCPCLDCGNRYPSVCMDFDHVRGDKRTNVSDMKTYRLDDILRETQKCDLVCSNCHRMRTESRSLPARTTQRRNFTETLTHLKSNPCVDCGHRYPPVVMDFDHVRGFKCHNISRMSGMSWDLAETEILKCDLVCSNCHRQRTALRRVA